MADEQEVRPFQIGDIVIPLYVEYLVDWYKQSTSLTYSRRFYEAGIVAQLNPLGIIALSGGVLWQDMKQANFIRVGRVLPEYYKMLHEQFNKNGRFGTLEKPQGPVRKTGVKKVARRVEH